jgi:hypothetical protein
MRWRGKDPLAAQALVRVSLSWLAAHAVLGEIGTASLVLALAFALAAWGNQRLAARLPRSLWLLNAGQVLAVLVLVMLKQPIVAGAVGLLFFGQVAMQPSLRYGEDAVHTVVSRRTWPWLMLLMLVAAWALP